MTESPFALCQFWLGREKCRSWQETTENRGCIRRTSTKRNRLNKLTRDYAMRALSTPIPRPFRTQFSVISRHERHFSARNRSRIAGGGVTKERGYRVTKGRRYCHVRGSRLHVRKGLNLSRATISASPDRAAPLPRSTRPRGTRTGSIGPPLHARGRRVRTALRDLGLSLIHI